jgi:5-methylcytosine-specific restriction protein A
VSRSIPEWSGATDDTPAPPRVRLRVLARGNYACACCGTPIGAKPWDLDHIVALKLGGRNVESNLQALLNEHHKSKTAADLAEKSRDYRKQSKHRGIKKRSSFATNRDGPFRKKLSGEVVRR